ncbi:hypothetical protein BOX15_Mlig004986g2 [Macrostomum lignano]|uniref:Uncharacterized protein n=1 Tax=Macrostomum lignano TaxID=282301 RepID=A0A267H4F4_9PLAT|nr:hypothetical protein BOX15_Mlig004986g2 [Macrostomum lignano]
MCWKWKNNRNETVLHKVLEHCRDEGVLEEIIDGIKNASDLLTDKDVDGNGVAHFAARNSADALGHLETQMNLDAAKLKSANKNGETVLHVALKKCSKERAHKLIKKASSGVPSWYELRDKQGDTCLHAIAQCSDQDDVLLEAVGVVAAKRQKNADEPSNKPILETIRLKSASRMQRWSEWSGQFSQQTDKKAEISNDPGCLLVQNKQKSTVLHYAVENCQLQTVNELLHKHLKQIGGLLIADKSGNTIFHIGAKRQDKSELFRILFEQYGVLAANEASKILRKRNNKNQSVLHLAIDLMDQEEPIVQVSHSQRFTMEHLINKMPEEELQRTDAAGNTLLHSLMKTKMKAAIGSTEPTLKNDKNAKLILDRFKLLVSKNVNAEALNNLNLNCLHATKLDTSVLCKLLEKIPSDDEAATIFKKILVNSKTGAHLIHTFSGQYNLQVMLGSMKILLNTKDKYSLIKSKVKPRSCENVEDADTCLHFACASGHRQNIVFLLENNLTLWSKSQSEKSCVDLAFENGNFDDLIQAVKEYNKKLKNSASENSQITDKDLKEIKMTDIWRLLDPPQRALKLPDRQAAQNTLVTITNDYGTTSVNSGTKKQKTDRMILIRALEMDSRKIFRAALSLNMITQETEAFFTKHFISTLDNEESIQRSFLRHNMFKRMTHVDDTSELALLDLAAFFDRDEILPELILTRQFELIPCCLSLLIQLGPEINRMRAKAKGKHEQLLQLQKKVTNIAMNALNELFVNASPSELKLLFRYIKGKMTIAGGSTQENNKEGSKNCSGPQFPYAVSGENIREIKYGSVLDLVEEADSLDLFATDCIYSLTRDEWRDPHSLCSECCGNYHCLPCRPKISHINSPRAKFWTHTTAFVGFLGFFGWYILNFQITFPLPAVDAILVAYFLSFASQEIAESWRLRSSKEAVRIGKYVLRIPAYIADCNNVFDVLAILFLFLGLVTRWIYYGNGLKLEEAYPSQMVLSTSFVLFCFRSVTFLSYFESVGPMISMLGRLIYFDLLPFLTILLVIVCCFGVFFTCLLFSFAWAPTAHVGNAYYGWEVFIQAATLPFNLLFSNFDQIKLSSSPNSTKLGEVAIKQGYEWFYYLLIFIFMGLVNVVMMNLLIALFNLRVTQIYGVATGIWRKKFFKMLKEYNKLPTIPPPFSFLVNLHYFLRYVGKKFCESCRSRSCSINQNTVDDSGAGDSGATDSGATDSERRSDNDQVNGANWWQDKSLYPPDYNRFLEFQAIQFRRCRSRLLRDTQWNRNDFDVAKAHTANELSELKLEVQEMLEDLKHQGEEHYHKHDNSTNAKPEGNERGQTSEGPVDVKQQVRLLLQESERNRFETKQLHAKTEGKVKRMRHRMKSMESKLEQVLAAVQQQH